MLNRNRLLTAAFVALLASTTAFSATFTVTKTGDTNDGTCDADCSFREAVVAANNSAGADEILFDGMVFGTPQTIVLSLGEIVITDAGGVTINGPGAGILTVDGNGASRILSINLASASIDGITFTGGNGAGTLNTGRGGAIYNAGGTTVISNSIITGNTGNTGGGLNNASTGSPATPGNLTLINCVISNNSSTSSGGAMQNFSTSTLTIEGSLIEGNTGGGSTGGGGGQLNGIVRVSNTTYANNSAPAGSGGGFQTNGTNQIFTNVTVSGNSSLNNGGGVHRATTNVNFFIRNSIVSGNNGTAASPDVTNSAGGISSEGSNIIGVAGTSTGWIGSDLLDTDPLLGMLQDNGGPTLTFLPMAGSPAIDAGDNCVTDLSCTTSNPASAITTDQRGVARPMGGTVDIGAVETFGPATVSGRVVILDGSPARGVYLSISDGMGVVQTVPTNGFGFFRFRNIQAGQTYTISAASKRAQFDPVMVDVMGDVANLTITSNAPFTSGRIATKR